MKKATLKLKIFLKKRSVKRSLTMLLILFFSSSSIRPLIFNQAFSQADFYNESGTGAADGSSIPSPPPGSVNTNSLMKAVTKFKESSGGSAEGGFDIVSEDGMDQKVQNADAEMRKLNAQKLEDKAKENKATYDQLNKDADIAEKQRLKSNSWNKSIKNKLIPAIRPKTLSRLAEGKKKWGSEGAECLNAKSNFQTADQPEQWTNPFNVSDDKLANKRIGHAYSPKFQGAMLFKECQGFANGEWDVLVGNKASGTETWAGSWHDMAKQIINKLKPYSLTPREWELAKYQLLRSESFPEIEVSIQNKLASITGDQGTNPIEDGCVLSGDAAGTLENEEDPGKKMKIKGFYDELVKICQMKKEWSGEGEGDGGPTSVMEKLKNIKKHITNVYPNLEAHFAKVRKCAALIHLTSTVDYGKTEYVTPSSAGGDEGGSNFNQITMQMQMAQQLQSGGEVAQEQRELSFSCSSSGAETQDYPACRGAISQMNAFMLATQGFNIAMKEKMTAANQRRVEKLKCQKSYLEARAKGENFEMSVSTEGSEENPSGMLTGGCAEFVTLKGTSNEALLSQSFKEKKSSLTNRKEQLEQERDAEGTTDGRKKAIETELKSINQELTVLIPAQEERLNKHNNRSNMLSIQQMALAIQKEGIEDQKKFMFTKMGFQATKLAVLGNSFRKFPDKEQLYGTCKSGLPELANVESENKKKFEEWIARFLEPYRTFKCRPIGFDVLEFVRGNIHKGEGFEEDGGDGASEDSGEDGVESKAISAKDKTTTDDPCQDTIGNSTIALLRNTSAREQLKFYLVGVGKDALVSMMQGMIFNNQANVVQAAIDGSKAMEQPFTMTPMLSENFNSLCSGPFAPQAVCNGLKSAIRGGKVYPSKAFNVAFAGGGATKIAPNKRIKLGVQRKAGNVKASTGGMGVDALGSGADMGGGGDDEAPAEAQSMQGLGEVASSEGGGGGDAGGPGLMEGGGDQGGGEGGGEGQVGSESASELQGGELQVAQFQGGGKMAGGGVGMDMGGMIPGGEGGEMSFRGPASGDGGVAGRAKGIFKIISKRYKSIHGRNKLLKYDKKK